MKNIQPNDADFQFSKIKRVFEKFKKLPVEKQQEFYDIAAGIVRDIKDDELRECFEEFVGELAVYVNNGVLPDGF